MLSKGRYADKTSLNRRVGALLLLLIAIMPAVACTKSKSDRPSEAHTVGSGTYEGGSAQEAAEVQASVEKLAENIALSPEAALTSFSSTNAYNGQSVEAAVQKYLYPSGSAVESLTRAFTIKHVEGDLEGSEAKLQVTVEGSLSVRLKSGKARDINEKGTYEYVMVREGGEWKVAGLRPLDVNTSYGSGFEFPGLLAEVSINGKPTAPDGIPIEVRAGESVSIECGFLGEIGARVSMGLL